MSSADSDSSEDDYYGPALPPGFKDNTGKSGVSGTSANTNEQKATAVDRSSEDFQIGPVLPPELRAKLQASASSHDVEEEGTDTKKSSSELSEKSSEEESDSDDDVIGPLPPDHPKTLLRAAASTSSSSESKKPKREEWMLVPPKNRIIPGLGLEPRQFLKRTPQDSKMSDEEEDEEAFAREAEAAIERKLIEEYDQKMDDMKKDFETKKRRGESLLSIHQKELKKKKEDKSAEKVERKPFDRDTDLQISGLSAENKQKYIEKSKELNTKFSRGSRKYL